MKNYPSIFNDVIGPVMRGPSSSHCAASLRIALICRDLMGGLIQHVLIEFDPEGSLATTHESQGSDMGLFGGFLGMTADDARLPDAATHLQTAGIQVVFRISVLEEKHPNAYKITLSNNLESHTVLAISTGGGMIEVLEIDGAKVSIAGDFYQTLIYTRDPQPILGFVQSFLPCDFVEVREGIDTFVEIKSQKFADDNIYAELRQLDGVKGVKKISPVLPILSRENMSVPFTTCDEMIAFNDGRGLSLWELAVEYEMSRGNISRKEVFDKMGYIVNIMETSIATGLKGTKYKDRLLGAQSVRFKEQFESDRLLGSGIMNQIIMYVSAMMEVKSSMGVIVAAPTAGSCGALPGAILGVADGIEATFEEKIKAMLASAMIGVFIAGRATFAAEVGGCQAECGSGAGMAAAGLVFLAKGSLDQSLSAASVALQNSLGMICDPIANRVEAPCLGKNVLAATNALACANMALSEYDHLIPLDEVIETMNLVGKSIPHTLRCTTLGGLSITKTARELESKLNAGSPLFFKSC